ncbi:hypothetical protein HYC85_024490 [Camellia sinensis]|uniref:Uncharacterized protein n=1 Tax=Camellia sinensis TaxID=4442 RepID=A0A7J7GC41_CAMSI|nr:hypothetical protein HYC85_024490 [Camellia sinensis]
MYLSLIKPVLRLCLAPRILKYGNMQFLSLGGYLKRIQHMFFLHFVAIALVAKLCEGTGVNANHGIISGVLVTVGILLEWWEFITWKLGTLASIVRQRIRKYLPELLSLISELWSSFSLPAANRPVHGSANLHLLEQLCLALNDEFRKHLPVILPCCVQVLSDAERFNDYTYVLDILHTLEVFGGANETEKVFSDVRGDGKIPMGGKVGVASGHGDGGSKKGCMGLVQGSSFVNGLCLRDSRTLGVRWEAGNCFRTLYGVEFLVIASIASICGLPVPKVLKRFIEACLDARLEARLRQDASRL